MGFGLGDLNPVRIVEGKGAIGESGLGSLIVGAGLASMGIPPGMAALYTGGATAALTGSLQKGLFAGMGAYGGAGLMGGLEALGAEGMTTEAAKQAAQAEAQAGAEALKSAGYTPDIASGTPLSETSELARTAGKEYTANASAMGPSPINAAQTGQTVQTTTSLPQTMGQNFSNAGAGLERLTSSGGIDALRAQMAASGGPSLNMAAGTAAAGALGSSIANQRNPAADAKPLAPGYIRQFAYDPFSQKYTALTPVAADKWGARTFQDAYKAADGGIVALAHGGDVKNFADGGYTSQQINDYIAQNNLDAAGIAAAQQQFGVSDAQLAAARAEAAPAAPAAPSYTSYTPEQISSYFAANPNADVSAAVKQFNADPNAVNQYITGLTKDYVDPTATQRGSGYLPQYQNLTNAGMSASEFAAAAQANDPNWGKGYWNPTTVSHAYDVANKIMAFDPQTDKVTPSDKEWVAFMDANKFSTDDIARATGLSTDEVQRRYDAAKEKPVVKTVTPLTGISNVPSVAGVSTALPGDITKNPDGTVTVHPNIPGGSNFTGVSDVKNRYTTGGGSLGYAPYAPKTPAEHAQMYDRQTGGSRAAFDYLMGGAPYPIAPSTPTGEVYKPYGESVLGIPADPTARALIWDAKTRRYIPNPQYVKPLSLEEKNAAAEKAKADATAKEAVDSIQLSAKGGLMGMASGGLGSLGGYSDGGRLLKGPGDGVSDSIPASIGDKQPARLADGEFVVPARIVSELGNGSTDAGARKLYAMMDRVQKARGKTTGKGKVATNSRADKYLPV